MLNLLKTVIKHCATGPDGETFDPARVIGYGTAISIIATFLFNSVWSVVHGAAWDPQAFGVGAAAVSATVVAAAAGVAMKGKSEPSA